MAALLVLTNLPDRAAAERIGDLLIEKKLAACVNILAPCRSVYRWKDAVQRYNNLGELMVLTQKPRLWQGVMQHRELVWERIGDAPAN